MNVIRPESDNKDDVNFTVCETVDTPLRANRVGLPPQILARFLAKIHFKFGDCWPWRGARNEDGHGRFNIGRRLSGTPVMACAHRVAYELAHGPLGDLFALHVCDNPPCCNPEHLYAGTQSQNMLDVSARGSRSKYKKWKQDPELKKIILECLVSPSGDGVVRRIARERGIPFHQLAAAVRRARQRQFLAATTGAAAALR